ncbi:MAG: hypothetical protein J6Z31_08220 [Fibrobacter sp.]|nr:hypothetical protein [Fibrobacter sp.]
MRFSASSFLIFCVVVLACMGVVCAADAKGIPDSTVVQKAVENDPRTEEVDDDDDDDPAGIELEEPAKIAESGKTGVPGIDSLQTYEWDVETEHNSLPLTLLFSLFPGGGQYYTGHYIRGGFITAVELGLAYEVFINKRDQKKRRFDQAREFQDSVYTYSRRMLRNRDSLTYYQSKRNEYAEKIRTFSDHKIEEEDLRKSELTWLIGVHIYSIFDAYGIWANNQGHSVEYRPVLGTLLRSFVPGWGQIYNREYGKAGLLYMGLLGASVSMFSRQDVIEYYLDRKHALEKEDPSNESLDRINEQILYYRKNRNQYIWGLVIIYLYSIGDAVVDAMMSDFDSPAHFVLGPDFRGGIEASITLDF